MIKKPCDVIWCVAAAEEKSRYCKLHKVDPKLHPRELTVLERAFGKAKETDQLAGVPA